jgi:hypothetical protein
MEHQSGSGERVSHCADVNVVVGSSVTKSKRLYLGFINPTGTYRCGDEGHIDKTNWDKSAAGALSEADDWFFVWSEGNTLVVERLDGETWDINLAFSCSVCPTGMPDGLAPQHAQPPPCVFSEEWRLRITKTIGGHVTGKAMFSLQELQIRAHDESGEDVVLNRYYIDEQGDYPEGCTTASLFDADSSRFPLIDTKCVRDQPHLPYNEETSGSHHEPMCDFGKLAWGYGKSACVTDFRFQTAKAGWWNCANKHCADPLQWVLEAEQETGWVAVMTQDMDYPVPIGRQEWTSWIPVAYVPESEEQTDPSVPGKSVEHCEEMLVFVGDSEYPTVRLLLGDEYPIGVYECGNDGNVDKTTWNWGIAGTLADENDHFFVSTEGNEIVVEQLDGKGWQINLAFTCNVHAHGMSKTDCPTTTAVIAPGIHTAYIEE